MNFGPYRSLFTSTAGQDMHLQHVRIYTYFGSRHTPTRVDDCIYLHRSGHTSTTSQDTYLYLPLKGQDEVQK
eukprot:5923929-Amphidinium_carterae.1